MRIRFTLDITRTPKPHEGEPDREGSADALVERAERVPIGFAVDPVPSITPIYRKHD